MQGDRVWVLHEERAWTPGVVIRNDGRVVRVRCDEGGDVRQYTASR